LGLWVGSRWVAWPLAPQRQLSGIDCHSHDGVDAGRVQLIYLIPRGDATRGGHAARRGMTHGHDGVHVGAAHQALGIDVGVEELRAEWLERPYGSDGRQWQ